MNSQKECAFLAVPCTYIIWTIVRKMTPSLSMLPASARYIPLIFLHARTKIRWSMIKISQYENERIPTDNIPRVFLKIMCHRMVAKFKLPLVKSLWTVLHTKRVEALNCVSNHGGKSSFNFLANLLFLLFISDNPTAVSSNHNKKTGNSRTI